MVIILIVVLSSTIIFGDYLIFTQFIHYFIHFIIQIISQIILNFIHCYFNHMLNFISIFHLKETLIHSYFCLYFISSPFYYIFINLLYFINSIFILYYFLNKMVHIIIASIIFSYLQNDLIN